MINNRKTLGHDMINEFGLVRPLQLEHYPVATATDVPMFYISTQRMHDAMSLDKHIYVDAKNPSYVETTFTKQSVFFAQYVIGHNTFEVDLNEYELVYVDNDSKYENIQMLFKHKDAELDPQYAIELAKKAYLEE